MSTVHVFVGQCGNQVGTEFLDTIASEAQASTDEAFQMRVSATHFRPALRVPRRRKQQQPRHTNTSFARGNDSVTACAQTSSFEHARRTGPQQYYSFSRYAQTADADAAAVDVDVEAMDASLPQPRCVLVDMEPKVIHSTLQRANTHETHDSAVAAPSRRFYTLAPQQCVTRGEGSGNNWAFGYYQQGQSRREAIAECLRRESEQQDTTVSTFHVLHSIAGGTGSGVSCLVAEEIKTMFPTATLLHSVVWPFQSGEVVTQWYNVLMAVSTLGDLADGVCIAYNDVVAEELKSSLANRGLTDAGEVSFPLINRRMSEMLAPLHLPQLLYATPSPLKDASKHRIARSGGPTSDRWITRVTGSVVDGTAPCRYATSNDIVEALTVDPAMRFFTGVTAPRLVTGSSTWTSVLGEAVRTTEHTFTSTNAFHTFQGAATAVTGALTPSLDAAAFYLQSRSCLWSLRGRCASTDGIRELRHLMATHVSGGATPFPLTSLFVSLCEEWRATPSGPTLPDHSVTLYGPTPMIGETFAEAARKAEELLNVGAFVHHFERYGVSKDELRDAAAVLWDTAAAYGGQ
ncbi:putative delta tubulin [Leptomonas pyrrhocoris]|uniref:Putative delta tubulin n=1 Tax=Leptomonas pyrrhocoris TaxID=157538 RepID=A0A0N1J4Y4_LEPPY|nr:putative delta tubulin [Leptomonas pyrrhocoris]KPA81574.1 putative delta tubulin [Leptomonas pyrrhocoris]|eukprot:XP_015660013.1 putative delta tubulin [Leptomonas pyrrhocoris]